MGNEDETLRRMQSSKGHQACPQSSGYRFCHDHSGERVSTSYKV